MGDDAGSNEQRAEGLFVIDLADEDGLVWHRGQLNLFGIERKRLPLSLIDLKETFHVLAFCGAVAELQEYTPQIADELSTFGLLFGDTKRVADELIDFGLFFDGHQHDTTVDTMDDAKAIWLKLVRASRGCENSCDGKTALASRACRIDGRVNGHAGY
jgi:hypothetical protein